MMDISTQAAIQNPVTARGMSSPDIDAGKVLLAFLPSNAAEVEQTRLDVLTSLETLTLTPGTPGDFDADGDVDGADFLLWQRGGSPDPLSSADLTDWQTNFGTTSSSSAASSAIPEPTSIMLVILALGWAASSRRRSGSV